MGRKEKPVVDKGNRFLVDLALWLRAEKARTGKSYRELAELADRHPTTLQRAASGNRVPRLPVVMAFAKACDAPPEEARRLWRDAQYEETVHGCPHRRHLCLACIGDAEELRLALREVHHRAGMPSSRVVERHAGPTASCPGAPRTAYPRERRSPGTSASSGRISGHARCPSTSSANGRWSGGASAEPTQASDSCKRAAGGSRTSSLFWLICPSGCPTPVPTPRTALNCLKHTPNC
ncbi:helix-turn-helix domain-containing protein [Streptomyces uncialis]|uniref:helix-turn-helix domain-containing protein n=1 Tax=Streptomyces uncialis TaxID=1048205 RepID=UPI0033C43AB9